MTDTLANAVRLGATLGAAGAAGGAALELWRRFSHFAFGPDGGFAGPHTTPLPRPTRVTLGPSAPSAAGHQTMSLETLTTSAVRDFKDIFEEAAAFLEKNAATLTHDAQAEASAALDKAKAAIEAVTAPAADAVVAFTLDKLPGGSFATPMAERLVNAVIAKLQAAIAPAVVKTAAGEPELAAEGAGADPDAGATDPLAAIASGQ